MIALRLASRIPNAPATEAAVTGVEKLVPALKKYVALGPWSPGATVRCPGARTSSCSPRAGMARLLKLAQVDRLALAGRTIAA